MTKSTHSTPASIDPAGWISQAEAARLRSVTRQAIAKLVSSGRLRTIVIGGRTFVSRADVTAFEPLPAGRPKGAGRE